MIVCQASKKGGAGKTLLTLSLSYESSSRGNNTLIIDADPNQGVMSWRNKRDFHNLELPANITIITRTDNAIHRDIKKLSKGFDNVFIDCPPQDNVITNSAMLASDFILIPCKPCEADVRLAHNTWELAKLVSLYNRKIKFFILMNNKQNTTNLSKSLKDEILSEITDALILKSEIGERVVYGESMGFTFVQEICKDDKPKNEISNLYDEIEYLLKEGAAEEANLLLGADQ